MITKITMISRVGDVEMDYDSLKEWKKRLESALEREYPNAEISIRLSRESGISSLAVSGTDNEDARDFIWYLSNKIWNYIF